jgi:hypothetical protein
MAFELMDGDVLKSLKRELESQAASAVSSCRDGRI